MNQNDYVAELRSRLSKNEKDLFVKENNSVMLILRNGCSEMKFRFACSRQTDFSEENLKKDTKFFEYVQKHILELDMKLCYLETEMSIDGLD
jgi:hypothetical protein